MTDRELVIEIEAAREQLDLLCGVAAIAADVSKRLDELIYEGCKRGLYRPSFRLV